MTIEQERDLSDRLIAQLELTISRLELLASEKDRRISADERTIAAQERTIAALERSVATRDGVIEDYERDLTDLGVEVTPYKTRCEQALAERQQRVRAGVLWREPDGVARGRGARGWWPRVVRRVHDGPVRHL